MPSEEQLVQFLTTLVCRGPGSNQWPPVSRSGHSTNWVIGAGKLARNEVVSELRRSKYGYEQDLATKIKTDNKLFWSYVCSKIKTKSNFGHLELPDGSFTNDNQERAEILNSYFASVFELEGSEALPDFEKRNFTEPLTSVVINAPIISKAIDKLTASKSQGPDQIHPKLIKECKDSLVEPLEIIFRKSVEISQIPSNGSRGILLPKAENYRPISLTSVPGKLLERLIRDEIVKHMEAIKKLWGMVSKEKYIAG